MKQQGLMPFDLVGNVMCWPVTGFVIDTDLCAVSGYPVSVAGVLSVLLCSYSVVVYASYNIVDTSSIP